MLLCDLTIVLDRLSLSTARPLQQLVLKMSSRYWRPSHGTQCLFSQSYNSFSTKSCQNDIKSCQNDTNVDPRPFGHYAIKHSLKLLNNSLHYTINHRSWLASSPYSSLLITLCLLITLQKQSYIVLFSHNFAQHTYHFCISFFLYTYYLVWNSLLWSNMKRDRNCINLASYTQTDFIGQKVAYPLC